MIPATVPANTGEIIHDTKILIQTSHWTDANPRAAMENPIMEPTISCVVDTGYPNAVAMNNNTLADNNDENIPNINVAGVSVYKDISTIFDRIVPVTDAPRKKAPENSKIDAMTVSKSVVVVHKKE